MSATRDPKVISVLVFLFASADISPCFSDTFQVQSNLHASCNKAMPTQNNKLRGSVIFAPAGLTLPVELQTSVTSSLARVQDPVQGRLNQPVFLGQGTIPVGTNLLGEITEAEAGRRLGRSGTLGIKFHTLRLPDGTQIPLNAHVSGGLEKLHETGEDEFKGENTGTKLKDAALRGGIGAGGGAVLGTAIGAIAGKGRGAGRGAWSGTAIGAGLGLADSLVVRKGHDVIIRSGTILQVQLDAPLTIASAI